MHSFIHSSILFMFSHLFYRSLTYVFYMVCLQDYSGSSGTFDRGSPHQLLLQRKDLFSKVIIMLTLLNLLNHKTCEGKCKHINFRMICRKTFKEVHQNTNVSPLIHFHTGPPWWRSSRACASHTGDWGSIPGQDRHRSLKQVVTTPLPNALQQKV